MQAHDNLETFIRENREAFDDQTPSLKVWSQVDKKLHGTAMRHLHVMRTLRVAAAAILLLITGALGGRFLSRPDSANALAILEQSAPEFLEAEAYYQKEIQSKVAQLAAYNPQDAVLQDLAQVDRVMEELKTELIKAPKGKEQEIISNLIRSYQTKIAILELVMDRLETNQSTHSKQNENEVSL